MRDSQRLEYGLEPKDIYEGVREHNITRKFEPPVSIAHLTDPILTATVQSAVLELSSPAHRHSGNESIKHQVT